MPRWSMWTKTYDYKCRSTAHLPSPGDVIISPLAYYSARLYTLASEQCLGSARRLPARTQ